MEELNVEQQASENQKQFAQDVKALVKEQGLVQVTSQMFYLEGITTTLIFYKDIETANEHSNNMVEAGWVVQSNGETPLFESENEEDTIKTIFVQYARNIESEVK